MKNYSTKTFWKDLRSGKFASMVKESSKGQQVSNAEEVYNVMKPLIAEHDDVEAVYGIFLDSGNSIIDIEKLFSGSIKGAFVYPRELAKKVFGCKASAVILVHNHPSGNTYPSAEDKNITVKIGMMLHSLDVSLLDHIIIGNGFHSFADTGLIGESQRRINEFMKAV